VRPRATTDSWEEEVVNMKKAGLSLAVVVLACVAVSAAMAGVRGPFGFELNTQNPDWQYAQGSFSDIHNSPDPYSRADCGTNWAAGYCSFSDTSGAYHGCYTTDPAQMAVIRSMTDENVFSVGWDTTGKCIYIMSYVSSVPQPKVH